MHPLSPALVIAGASALVGSRRHAQEDLDPVAAAAFIGHVGYWALYDEIARMSTWPFPVDADCEMLASLAEECGVRSSEAPAPGTLYLGRSPGSVTFTRAGIVVATTATAEMPRKGRTYRCTLLEGSALLRQITQSDGRTADQTRIETEVQWARRRRVWCTPALGGDLFISWVDLDDRCEPTRVSRRRAA